MSNIATKVMSSIYMFSRIDNDTPLRRKNGKLENTTNETIIAYAKKGPSIYQLIKKYIAASSAVIKQE